MLIIKGSFKKSQKHLIFNIVNQSQLQGTPNLPVSFSVVGTTTAHSGSFANAGVRYFQTIAQNIGDYVGAEGWSQPFAESLHTGTISWQNDPTAPFSSSHVMTVTLTSGTYLGTPEPWLGEIDFQTSSKKQAIYYVVLFKLNSNFQGHKSGANKITYIWSNAKVSASSTGAQLLMEPSGVGTASLFPNIALQGGSADPRDGAGFLPVINNIYQIPRNKWVRWEVFAQMNSYNSNTNTYNSDGILQSWITSDGETTPTQIHNVSDLKFDGINTGGATFVELQHLYLYGGNGTSSLFADNQIEFSRAEVYTGPAIFTTTSFIPTFNTASSPHASWVEFGYTDFRTPYVPINIQNQEWQFLAGHMDSIMSGPRPDIYNSASITQIVYTLLYHSKIYDNATSLPVAYWRDAQGWATGSGHNEEDLYVHLSLNEPSYKYPIKFISSSGLLQIQDGDPTAFVSESIVYIAGTNNINLDGTHSISNYTYTPPVNPNGLTPGIVQFKLDTVGFTTNTGSVQHQPGDGTKSPTKRIVQINPSFPPIYWAINPASSASHEYHKYRYGRILPSSYNGEGNGVFIDTMTPTFIGSNCLEYSSSIANQYLYDMANLLTDIRTHMSSSTNIVRINIGNYAVLGSSIMLSGSLHCHMETTNNPRHNGWFNNTNLRGFVVSSANYGVLIELVNSFAWSDTLSGGGGNYANDFKPDGANGISMVRQKIAEYACYLSCLHTSSLNGRYTGSVAVGGVICALWNDSWTPLSNISGSALDRWLPIFEFPLGKQLNDIYVINSGVDPVGQKSIIRQLDYQSCSIFMRGVDDATTTNFGDTAASIFPLPISSGSTGKWKRIMSDGNISASLLTTGSLRPAEAIFLVPV